MLTIQAIACRKQHKITHDTVLSSHTPMIKTRSCLLIYLPVIVTVISSSLYFTLCQLTINTDKTMSLLCTHATKKL